MLELMDYVVIFVILVVTFLIFIRLLVAVLKRLLPQMVPELMKGVGSNLPNISLKQGIGMFLMEFINQGGMQMIIQKIMGVLGGSPPQQPPRLPPGVP